jgi:hypothetical protein
MVHCLEARVRLDATGLACAIFIFFMYASRQSSPVDRCNLTRVRVIGEEALS